MKHAILIPFALCAWLVLCVTSTSAQSVALFDELAPLYPDSDPAEGAPEITLHVPRGSSASVHVLLTGLAEGAPIDALAPDSPAAPAIARLRDVPVEENTGLESRTEDFDRRTNPHVIRRAPFRTYDAIEPTTTPVRARGETEALRLTWRFGPDAAPGTFEIPLAIRVTSPDAERFEQTLRVRLIVHEATVPPAGADTVGFTNWINLGNIARYHNLEPWSEPYWNMLAQYAELIHDARQNTFLIPWGAVFHVEGTEDRLLGAKQMVLDTDRLERLVSLFTDAGMHTIEMGHPLGRKGGEWSATTFVVNQTGEDIRSAEGEAQLRDAFQQLSKAVDQHGWRDRWVQHLADEPIDANADAYRRAAEITREALDVPIFEATMTRSLAQAVDIWCPQVQNWQRAQSFFDERQAAGDRVWVYTCLIPGGPWCNRLLDMEHLRQVWIGWMIAEHDLDGYLHWGLNAWRSDPFEQSVHIHTSERNPRNKLPAGDTHAIYPGETGPLSSLRLEAQRIGLEDAELIRTLRAHNPAAATTIVESVVRGFDDYSTDIAAYRDARRRLLEASDALSR